MTLCIAWKKGRNVQLWSDSRLSYPDGKVVDMAIKVVSFPIFITEIKDKENYYFNKHWGMCFAGSGQTIYYIKDFIVENLKNLEFSKDLFELTAEKITSYINKIYEIACNKFFDKLSIQESGCRLIITGVCPQTSEFKTFLLIIKYDNASDRCICEPLEILINENYYFIGSGEGQAKDLYDAGLIDPYQIMKRIIDNNLVSSVGGQIQFGENVNSEFTIKGVAKVLDNITTPQLRGIDLYDADIFDYSDDLKPNTSFLINLNEYN